MTIPTTRIAGVCVVAALSLAVAGCTSGGGSADTSGSGGGAANIAAVAGGPNPYFDSWEPGTEKAASDFDIAKITYEVPPSITFSLDVQNSTIDALVGEGYNGIALFPNDPQGSNATLERLANRGIPSVAIAGCTADPTPAVVCFATDVEEAAYDATKFAIERIGGEGELAFLTGFLTDPNTPLRINGAERAVAETGGAVTLVQTLTDIDTPDAARPAVENLLSARGDTLDAIVAQSYYSSDGVAAVMLDQPEYQDIVTVLEDNSPSVMEALEAGAVTATLWQNPYGQAYLGAYVLDKIIADGCEIPDDAGFEDSAQSQKFVNSGYQIFDNTQYADIANTDYSVPSETERAKSYVDDEILSC